MFDKDEIRPQESEGGGENPPGHLPPKPPQPEVGQPDTATTQDDEIGSGENPPAPIPNKPPSP